ncbi:hypothetical protein DAI22_06g279903 [Oryza sativa Japonica Group]|nr:hypothetical protein DAI22_06g279903 [Oryza sativa Japonica Group]
MLLPHAKNANTGNWRDLIAICQPRRLQSPKAHGLRSLIGEAPPPPPQRRSSTARALHLRLTGWFERFFIEDPTAPCSSRQQLSALTAIVTVCWL